MLSIVIVSFNARADLVNCLLSLKTHPPAMPHEIIVVDNASTDDSVAAAQKVPGVHVIEMGRNAGFAAANNAGIAVSRGDLLLLLNSDTLVPAGALDALTARLGAMPAAAIAGPRLIDAEGRPELSFGRMISPLNELWQQRRSEAWIARETGREQFVDWVSGACLLVRRQDAVRAGLLDERFFLYTEDVDFCHAVRFLGRKVLFTPVATITHLRGRSRSTRPEASQRAYRQSHVAFYEKHHPLWAPLLKLYLRLRGEPLPGRERHADSGKRPAGG
ncbi:MAG TPA: glycosyltransferase family 2 protein [Vicinamibacterales bacterium]|nr:glycosyltransferase family 2 protein [Vicinamibacterales bacterium]